jgi:putative ABC transport system permease protein
VTGVEGFNFTSRAICDCGGETQTINVFALSPNSAMLQPPASDGRWLQPDDSTNVVINSALERKGVHLGDTLNARIDGHPTTVQVVGVFDELMGTPGMYVNQPFYTELVGDGINSVWITTDSETKTLNALETAFADRGRVVIASYTFSEWRSFLAFHFNLITVFLMVMAVILAAVGGLGLMGTVGISVLERTREIGILRAVGASNTMVMRLFIGEGVVIGLLSWLLASVLAFPPGKHLSDAVGTTFLKVPLNYTFSFAGVGLWIGIVVILAVLASLLPASRAARLSVRDVLAYE